MVVVGGVTVLDASLLMHGAVLLARLQCDEICNTALPLAMGTARCIVQKGRRETKRKFKMNALCPPNKGVREKREKRKEIKKSVYKVLYEHGHRESEETPFCGKRDGEGKGGRGCLILNNQFLGNFVFLSFCQVQERERMNRP